MPKTSFTFRVDDEPEAALSNAAKAHDRPGSQLLRDYEEKAEHDAWSRAEVGQGQRELEDPNLELVPHEQVVAELEIEKAELLARIAAPKNR